MSLRKVSGKEFLAVALEHPWDFSAWEALCRRLDGWAARTTSRLSDHYACRKGCHHCCRRIPTLLPVEWAALQQNYPSLSPDSGLRSELYPGESLCGHLATDGSCRVYEHRPVICRTHGHALLLRDGKEASVDFCPMNFTDLEELGEEDLLDLEQINEDLLRANAFFLKMSYPARLAELWQWRVEWQPDVATGSKS